MEEIVDLIATDSAASDITTKIKDVLFAKSANKIESQKSTVANAMFAEPELESEVETEPTEEPE
tara:strand:+ start:445 stop:636 length:192 start_codon:yes stop_codon:yes gene_type:complete